VKRHPAIDDTLKAFVEAQPVYFAGTASEGARISVSPKGIDSFRVLGPNRVAYADMTGSTNEAAAHLQRDSRITILFCSFTRTANIVRIYGEGRVVLPSDPQWGELAGLMPRLPGTRQFIDIAVDEVIDNCGYGVPEMTLVRERPSLTAWSEQKGEDGLRAYRQEKNRVSIDGLSIEVE
jgi:hypothetical protein